MTILDHFLMKILLDICNLQLLYGAFFQKFLNKSWLRPAQWMIQYPRKFLLWCIQSFLHNKHIDYYMLFKRMEIHYSIITIHLHSSRLRHSMLSIDRKKNTQHRRFSSIWCIWYSIIIIIEIRQLFLWKDREKIWKRTWEKIYIMHHGNVLSFALSDQKKSKSFADQYSFTRGMKYTSVVSQVLFQ